MKEADIPADICDALARVVEYVIDVAGRSGELEVIKDVHLIVGGVTRLAEKLSTRS